MWEFVKKISQSGKQIKKNNLPVLPVTFLRCVPISPLNLSCEFKSSGSSCCSLHLMVNSSTHLFSCRILL